MRPQPQRTADDIGGAGAVHRGQRPAGETLPADRAVKVRRRPGVLARHRHPGGRGVIHLPQKISDGQDANQALGVVKRALNPQKAGHAGTLDPLASGILPIALGEATKTVPYVQDSIKIYNFSLCCKISNRHRS